MTRSRPRSRRRAATPHGGTAAWRRWFPLALGLALLFVAPMLAFAQGGGSDSVTVSWTAPGDDGSVGTATQYDMRVSTQPITLANWNQAGPVPGLPAPLVSGSRQTARVRSLSRDTTYYFAIRTADDAGNWSGVSNLVRWDWNLDTAPPGAPSGIAANQQPNAVRVSWNANSEPDLQGYSVYRASAAGGPFARITGSLVTVTHYDDTTVPAGATAVWYRVTATDLSGNESAQSASLRIDLSAAAGVGADWTLSAVYPNPSRSGQPVCIPVVIPIDGAGNASLEIDDAGGRRIRSVRIADASACVGGVEWDGRNDAGRDVAPGVYRVWLVVGERRDHLKLVRQP
jgi:hypothetical protein